MIQLQWWHAHKGFFPEGVDFTQVDDPAKEVCKVARQLWTDQGEDRRQRQQDSLELYHGCDWSDDQDGGALRGFGIEPDITGYNVIQSVTDTSVSRLVQSRIRPLILTEGADAKLQKQAELLQKLIEGTFWEAKIYGELGEHVCFDGHLFDAGGVKVYPDYEGMRLRIERIDPCRFLVPLRETRTGNPTQAYYYNAIDRAELLAMFRNAEPDVIAAIENAKPADPKLYDIENQEFVDDVEIFEAWHLPSSRVDRDDPKVWGLNEDGEFDPDIDPGHDGRRVLCIDGFTLINEPWPFPYFPVAWFKPQRKRRSYWSRSVSETLAGGQLMVNQMNQRVDNIMHMHGRPITFVSKQAKVNTNKITNGPATLVEVNGNPSQAVYMLTPQAVPNEYLQRIDRLIAWMKEQVGMNDMAMTGEKPAGIDHAPGMEHLSDELTARHTTKMHAWEGFHTTLAEICTDGHRMLYDFAKRSGKNYKVVFVGSKDLQQIDFGDCDLGKNVYRWKTWPTNLLPLTPAAKANKLFQWVDGGYITISEAFEKLDHPDTDSIQGDASAFRKNIELKLAKLIGGESFEDCMPQPYMDLELAKKMCSAKLNDLEARGYDEKVLDRLRQFYETAQSWIDKQAQKQASLAAVANGNGPPPGPPGIPAGPPPGAMPPPPPGPPMPPTNSPPIAA